MIFTDSKHSLPCQKCLASGGRGSAVGRARLLVRKVMDLDPRSGRPLPTGWVGVIIMWPAEAEVMVSPLCLRVAARKIARLVRDIV